jgi:hypothetical protein
MEKNTNPLTANEARMLDKMLRRYEFLLSDTYLKNNILNLEANYNQVMQRIFDVTQPFLEKNIYSIPGISKPIEI